MLPRQSRTLLFVAVIGLSAGGVAVAFHVSIHWLYELTYVQLAKRPVPEFLALSFVVIMAASLLVGILLNRYCPAASGSGIPQVKLAFWKEFGYMPWRVVWVKFLAGVASVGGGISLGREGPSVQLSSGLASNVAGWMGEPKQGRRLAAASGAAAGLAAAFNTPLAATTFVLEEIITDLNSRLLGSVLLASVLGALVVHALIGKQPAFSLALAGAPGWLTFGMVPVVAGLASLMGVAFQKATLQIRARRRGLMGMGVAPWMRPLLGGLVTWILGSAVFVGTGHLGVFGLGYQDLNDALNHNLTWQLAGILLLAKWLATVASYGFGGCGGIFSPTLFLGGMAGVFLAGIIGLFVPLPAADQTMLAVVGMSACLGAVVRAPMTGILIVFEMTHDFALVPALMVTALISQTISRRLVRESFYEEILVQDGHNLDHVIPPRDLRSWLQLPVSAIANFQPVRAVDLEPETIRQLLERNPYRAFPAVADGKPIGILTRKEAQNALTESRRPALAPAVCCPPGYAIGQLQQLLIESPNGVVLLEEPDTGKLMGLITLHDLLRAEVALAESGVE